MPSDTADYLGADPRDLFPWLRPGANGTMPWSNAVSQVTPNITGPPPNVGMQAPAPPDFAPGPVPSYQPGVNGPMTPDDSAMAALDRYRHAIEAKPQLNKPGGWQRLAAAVAGGLAGWTNAAGRLRHPIDIHAMSEGILHPGYQANLERWKQNELDPAKELAVLEGQKQAEWWKSKQLRAQIEEMGDRGAYYKHRAEMEQNQWKIDPKSGTIYNTVTGEHSAPPATPKDRYEAAKAVSPNTPEDMLQYYALNGNLAGYGGTLAKPDKPYANVPAGGAIVDPTTGKELYFNPRQFKPDSNGSSGTHGSANQFKQVEQKKGDRLIAEEKNYEAQLKTLGHLSSADDKKAISDRHEAEKQTIQNDYENEIATLGGDPGHYSYNSSGQATAPQAAPPQAAKGAPVAGGKGGQLIPGGSGKFVYIPGG